MISTYILNRVNVCKRLCLSFIKSFAILCLVAMMFQSCVPRCTKFPAYERCKVRMRHLHGGQEYRGVPIYKKQHMQYGEKYKGPSKDAYSVSRVPKNKKRLVKKKKNVTTKIKSNKTKRTTSPIISPFKKKTKGG